jgi:hypothetical protein
LSCTKILAGISLVVAAGLSLILFLVSKRNETWRERNAEIDSLIKESLRDYDNWTERLRLSNSLQLRITNLVGPERDLAVREMALFNGDLSAWIGISLVPAAEDGVSDQVDEREICKGQSQLLQPVRDEHVRIERLISDSDTKLKQAKLQQKKLDTMERNIALSIQVLTVIAAVLAIFDISEK